MLPVGAKVTVKENAGTMYDGAHGTVVRHLIGGNVVRLEQGDLWYSDSYLLVTDSDLTQSPEQSPEAPHTEQPK